MQQQIIAHCGGECYRCRTNYHPNIYDFHHINPLEKEFNLDRANFSRSVISLIEEAKKCVLLCANCHREVHTWHDRRFLDLPIPDALNIDDILDNHYGKNTENPIGF